MNPTVKSIFAKVLPTLAAAVVPGGPFATMGINAVVDLLGGKKIDPTPDALDAAIIEAQKTNPNILGDLKKADQEFQLRLAEMGYDSEEKILALQNADRADARAREVAIKDKTPRNLVYILSFGFFAVLVWIGTKGVNPTARDVIMMMVGSLGTKWGSAVDYFVGSSSGSAKKTEMLAGQASDK